MVVIKKLTFKKLSKELILVHHSKLNEYEVIVGSYEPITAISKGYFKDLQTAVKIFYETSKKLYTNQNIPLHKLL
jgi:hypothetical protein